MPKVLLVEDTAETRAALRLQLMSLKCQVTEASDGEEALLLLDLGNEFDLILSDWHMKPMDGLQFCVLARRHRERFGQPPIPIVLLTADSRAATWSDREKASDAAQDIGIVEILAKPATMTEIGNVIARHCK